MHKTALANLYLNPLDHYIKHTVGVRSYGRYVDDFVIMHEDRRFLSALVPRIASLNLQAHLLERVSPWWWRWFTLGPAR